MMSKKIVKVDAISLYTESFGDQVHPAIVFIAGAGAPARFWTDHFVQLLVDAGYFVIRFDHRDTGLSSAVDFDKNPYTAFDLAHDVLAIMDAYDIKQAHVVGHSMGGLIAQLLAIHYSERLLSMTSISVGTVGQLGTPPEEVMAVLLENKPTQNFEESLPDFMRSWRVLNGTISVDEQLAYEYTKDLYERSHHPVGVAWNHIKCQQEFGDLSHDLAHIKVPALFIHGECDPLIPVQAGKATAQAVPHAQLVIIPGMGHMIFDKNLENDIAKRLIEFFDFRHD